MTHIWSVLITLLLITVTGPVKAQRVYTKTTVCEVLSSGAAKRLRNVEIRANVMADHMHYALLTDPECPGKGIFLDVSSSNADQSVKEFDHVLWSDGSPGFGHRTITAVFFGQLRIGVELPMNPRHKKISIAVLKVEGLSDTQSNQEH